MKRHSPRLRRTAAALAIGCVGIACAFGLSAPAIAAQPTASSCPTNVSLSNPFLPWNDASSYVFAPDGGLEADGGSWTLTGGAAVVNGNESFYVHRGTDAKALRIPSGATATTAVFCLDPSYPTMRFFVAGGSGARLFVDVLYVDSTARPGGIRSATSARPAPGRPPPSSS